VGPQTLEICARAGIAVLALESGKTLVLEQEQVETLAKRERIALLTV